jgi:hypothetical protein
MLISLNILVFFISFTFIFFARPKKTKQKKGRPASRFSLLVPPALSKVEGSKVEGSEVEGSIVEGSIVEGRFSKRAGPFRTRPPKKRGLKQRKGLFPPVSAMLGAGTDGNSAYG